MRDQISFKKTLRSFFFKSLIACSISGAFSANISFSAEENNEISEEYAIKIAKDITYDQYGVGDDPQDQIGKDLIICKEKSLDMVSIGGCYLSSYKKYKYILDATYRYVLGQTDKRDVKEAIENSQEKWIAYLEYEIIAEQRYENTGLGSVGSVVLLNHNISIVRERISNLMTYTHIHEG